LVQGLAEEGDIGRDPYDRDESDDEHDAVRVPRGVR
jgi:hypothetical protein